MKYCIVNKLYSTKDRITEVPQLYEESRALWLKLVPKLFGEQASRGGTTRLPEMLYLKMSYKGEELELCCKKGWEVYFPNHHSPMSQRPGNDRHSKYAIIFGDSFIIRLYDETDRVRVVYTSLDTDRARAFAFA